MALGTCAQLPNSQKIILKRRFFISEKTEMKQDEIDKLKLKRWMKLCGIQSELVILPPVEIEQETVDNFNIFINDIEYINGEQLKIFI